MIHTMYNVLRCTIQSLPVLRLLRAVTMFVISVSTLLGVSIALILVAEFDTAAEEMSRDQQIVVLKGEEISRDPQDNRNGQWEQ